MTAANAGVTGWLSAGATLVWAESQSGSARGQSWSLSQRPGESVQVRPVQERQEPVR